ncbi:group I truncated hemoglobin [Aquariibacter lacus]|nr:group 1 truncated hemoglobin [Piscinibacter lacus]
MRQTKMMLLCRCAAPWVLAMGLIGTGLPAVQAAAPAAPTLYSQLGGEAAIAKVIDTFLTVVGGDPRIAPSFAGANLPRLRTLLVEQVCEATGGPCKYTGRDMKSSHAGMGITEAQFNALAEALYTAMDREGVPYALQNRLMALLAPMHRDIVTR